MGSGFEWLAHGGLGHPFSTLKGQTRKAYVVIPIDKISSYDAVKVLELERFQLTLATYHLNFVQAKWQQDESPATWEHLGKYLDRWLELQGATYHHLLINFKRDKYF